LEGKVHQHVWLQKLKKLNPKLRVCQFENSNHLPGIYYVDEREGVVDICATDKQWVPAMAKYDARGFMVKSGYRRIVHTLLQLKLTTREKVLKVFPGFFESRYPNPTKIQSRSIHQQWSEMMKDERKRLDILGDAQKVDVADPIIDKMRQMELDNHYRRGSAALSGDQFIELAEDVKEQMTDQQIRNLDEAKFELDKATGKRKKFI
jgi:hypothetical protein